MLKYRHLTGLTLASAVVLAIGMAPPVQAASMPENIYANTQRMDAQDMKQRLQDLGFTQVEVVSHSGHITDFNARWEGKPVALTVDDRHGGIETRGGAEAISTAGDMSPAYVREQLEHLGYTQVGDVSRSGDVIDAEAVHMGRPVMLSIDARSGGVTVKGANDTAIVTTPSPMDEQYLERQLATLGYSDVRNVERSGNVYELEALKGEVWKQLKIDGDDGGVTVVN